MGGRPRDITVSYQLQCDALYGSKLTFRVRELRVEDQYLHQIIPGGQMIPRGTKRKRTETDGTVNGGKRIAFPRGPVFGP